LEVQQILAYLPGTVRTVPASASAATMGRIDFGHGPDFLTPISVSDQAIRATQRMVQFGSAEVQLEEEALLGGRYY
jgi:hypothetical protein